jgi:hypothetical protein
MYASVSKPVACPALASARQRRSRPRVTPSVLRAHRTQGDATQGARSRDSRAVWASASADDDGSANGELSSTQRTHQWMAVNYQPWVNSPEDAEKCLKHLRDVENREFDLEKAKSVLVLIKADHAKQYRDRVPFALPKRYPGFLHVLERSSVRR